MKKLDNEVRSKMIKIRVNDDEKKQLKKMKSKSSEKNLSDYMRKVSMQEPVNIIYRNQSADEFLREMIELKKQLSGIANNFNQAVHKLHTLDQIPEFRDWNKETRSLQKTVAAKIEEIKSRMNQLYEQWLQK